MSTVLLQALHRYAELTAQMLVLAGQRDWEAWLLLVPARDQAFAVLDGKLQRSELDAENRAILDTVLQQNQQMISMVEAKQKDLSSLLQNNRQQQKISSRYR